MKYLDEYRDPETCRQLIEQIRKVATCRRTIMEVCGGQTHGLLRYGIDQELAECVQLIHGPGCPVCVTPLESIDFAVNLARRADVWLTTFGDMIRVPGSETSLLRVRGEGGHVKVVYSPLDAVQWAREHPERQVVFFAVGFETTAPATALAVQQAHGWGLTNFSLLVSHVRVLPAMEMLASAGDHHLEGFLAAGHVCTVTGYACYVPFVERYGLPVVVTGFEPVDLLTGILQCLRLIESGESRVDNCYARSVRPEGNREAMALVDRIYQACDRPWRGLGVVAGGGFRLRDSWADYDAERRFAGPEQSSRESEECRSGEVLAGRIKPPQCECFGTTCTPETPLGAPMVSAEGACAAYYRYANLRHGR